MTSSINNSGNILRIKTNKFRVFSINTGKYFDSNEISSLFINALTNIVYISRDVPPYLVQLENCVIQEATSYCDRNRKSIYIGDIVVESSGQKWRITGKETAVKIADLNGENAQVFLDWLFCRDSFEIIGNSETFNE